MEDILDDFNRDKSADTKVRHGCVTAWIALLAIGSALSLVSYFFFGGTIAASLPEAPSTVLMMAMGLVAGLNIFFCYQIYQWKKIGFYGFIGSSIIALVLNYMMGIGLLTSLSGLIGIALLYAVLQMKGNGVSAWNNLD